MASKAWRISLLVCALVFSPLFFTDVHAANCGTCQLTADTNVPTGDATVWVLVDDLNYTSLPHTFSFQHATTHTIQVLNQTLPGGSSGARYVWKQWSINTTGNLYTSSTTFTTPPMVNNYTMGQNGEFIAEYQQQFQLSLSFTDPSGQPVSPPESVTLQSGTSTIVDSSYGGQWLDAKVWTVANATWEGNPNTESGTASFDLSAGPVTGTLVLKAYTATIIVVDKSNIPLVNATVIVTFANETIRTFNADNQGKVHLGHIPLGPYSIQVKYHGQNMGNWSADASSSSTLTTVLDVSGSQQPTPLPSPLALVTTYWYLAAAGFVAGFICIGLTARLTGRKTPPVKSDPVTGQ